MKKTNLVKLFLVVSMFLMNIAFASAVNFPTQDDFPKVLDEADRGKIWANKFLVLHNFSIDKLKYLFTNESNTTILKDELIQARNLNLTDISVSNFTNDANYLVTVGNINIDTGTIKADKLNISTMPLSIFANDVKYQLESDAMKYENITSKWANIDLDSTNDFDGAYSSLSGVPTTIMLEGENVGLLNNDAGYLTSYTETDPIFSAWDKSTGVSITESQISDLYDNGVIVDSQIPQAFKAEYNIDTSQGAWVHGVKVELTRNANIQPATGAWFGGQFVLNAGSDAGYAILNKPAYALQAIFKGSRTDSNSAEANVARFETQSDGKVDDMVYILANTDTTVEGSGIYIANHGTMPNAIQINGAGGTLTDGIDILGNIAGYGIDMNSASIGNADVRLSGGTSIKTGSGDPSGSCSTGDLYIDSTGGSDTSVLFVCQNSTWVGK